MVRDAEDHTPRVGAPLGGGDDGRIHARGRPDFVVALVGCHRGVDDTVEEEGDGVPSRIGLQVLYRREQRQRDAGLDLQRTRDRADARAHDRERRGIDPRNQIHRGARARGDCEGTEGDEHELPARARIGAGQGHAVGALSQDLDLIAARVGTPDPADLVLRSAA